MGEKKKNILKNWKLWIVVIVIIILVILISILILRNKMTPEETVSKFMYLIENKEYEKAKKLSNGKLEMLDVLSNIKPSSLTFNFSEDKKEAKSIIMEDDDTVEMTTMYIKLNNTILGWKISSYTVETDFIPQNILQKRMDEGKELSQNEFFYWGISEETEIENVPIYAVTGCPNGELAILNIFVYLMKNQQYDRAIKLYQPLESNSESLYFKELNEEEMKKFNWGYCGVEYETGESPYTLSDGTTKISIIITFDKFIRSISKYNN